MNFSRRGSSSRSPKGVVARILDQDVNIPRNMEVRPREWPHTPFMTEAGFHQEFMQFIANVELTNFLSNECDQYYLLTNSFNVHLMPQWFVLICILKIMSYLSLNFVKYACFPITGECMSLSLRNSRISSSPYIWEKLGAYQTLGPLVCIFPSVHYFSLFIGKCITAMEQGGGLNALTLAIMCCALYGDNTYILGSIVAHRLHLNGTRSKIKGGIYDTRLPRHFNVAICPSDYLLPKVYLDHHSVIEHLFIEEPQPPQHLHYI